ncbi:hypothetical protein D1872_262510 [compost metagenome]
MREERFARTGRPQEKDITLLQLDIIVLALRIHPLVMVVNRHGERLLRLLLTDNVLIQNIADFHRFRNFLQIELFLMSELFLHNLRAQFNTFVTYINARSGNQLADLFLRFAAERAF